jgi:hypothetical protein
MQTLKIYTNIVVINGVEFTNTVKAENFSEALEIQRDRKKTARHSEVKYKGRLTFSGIAN